MNLYYGALIYLIYVYTFFTICALLWQWRRATAEETWFTKSKHPRVIRALIMAYHIVYIQMCIFCFQIVHCTKDVLTNEWVLATEPSQQW